MRSEKSPSIDVPTSTELMWPAVQALRTLGGSARNEELFEEVVRLQNYSEHQVSLRRREDDPMGLLEYRLGWARTDLKAAGALSNSSQGVWSLTEFGFHCTPEELREQYEEWRREYRRARKAKTEGSNLAVLDPGEDGDGASEDRHASWKRDLLDVLLELSPTAFERVAQRLLREANFQNVEVLGRSGDGGIDGMGDYKLSLVSFPVYFQCKRYRGTVGPGAVRDFRGAMSGRGEKGLLITTGSFTKDAREEATRDGAPPVQLINGDELCALLREYRLGVEVSSRVVEETTVDPSFFQQFN